MEILVADDHTMFRSGLRRIIEQEFPNAYIDEASSCATVLDKIRTSSWSLVILDIAMGEQNSLNILPDIKRAHPDIPVLVLSMYNDRHFIIQSLRAGASGYLTKEHTSEELITGMKTVLSGHRYISGSVAENLAEYLAMGGSESPHEALSVREREVFLLIARGRSVSEIATMLSVSVKTVSTYRARILEKIGLGSNAELMRYALKHGLVE
ncbi:MAG: response regulator transcription factor [Candidatus Melainabacteria bacterium]|jgi:DNA-binding NarL/FixJ family response regulator|nr:response regulator transcription factor [Candidatus Melainabacteria bacterium]